MFMKNVTISLDEELAKEIRIMAANRSKSLSRFIADHLSSLVEGEKRRRAAKEIYFKRGTLFDSGGKLIRREDLYDRKILR